MYCASEPVAKSDIGRSSALNSCFHKIVKIFPVQTSVLTPSFLAQSFLKRYARLTNRSVELDNPNPLFIFNSLFFYIELFELLLCITSVAISISNIFFLKKSLARQTLDNKNYSFFHKRLNSAWVQHFLSVLRPLMHSISCIWMKDDRFRTYWWCEKMNLWTSGNLSQLL